MNLLLILLAVAALPTRRSLAWMGTSLHTDAQLNSTLAWFAAHNDGINIASPTTHALGANGTLVERPLSPSALHTPAAVFHQLRAAGVRVLPTIFNGASGYRTSMLPLFNALVATPAVQAAFIDHAVSLAVSEGLDGWSIDFELGSADWAHGWLAVEAAGRQLASLVDAFATALHARGKVLSMAMGTDTNPKCLSTCNGGDGIFHTADCSMCEMSATAMHDMHAHGRAAMGTDTSPKCHAPELRAGCFSVWWQPSALDRTGVDRLLDMSTYKDFPAFVTSDGSTLRGYASRHDEDGGPSSTVGPGLPVRHVLWRAARIGQRKWRAVPAA